MIIDCCSVSKVFNGQTALNSVSFRLEKKQALAVLGANGSGKTTLIRLLTGVLTPDTGTVLIFGDKIHTSAFALKRRMGIVIEEQTFFLDMTAAEYLTFFSELYRIPDAEAHIRHMLEFMQLETEKDKKIGSFSTGMKKKLNIIQAVLHTPELLICDEPFSGLDPQGIQNTLALLEQLKRAGSAIIISSHIISEIEAISDSVLILERGTVKAHGKKEQLWQAAVAEKKLSGPSPVLSELYSLFTGTEQNAPLQGTSVYEK